MKKEIMLHIEAYQLQNEEKEHVVTLDTVGLSYKNQGYLCLEYEETELIGIKGTKAQILIPENNYRKVIVRRTGSSSMQQVFEEGKKYQAAYRTPYGEMSVEVNPHVVDVEKNPDKLDIGLSYDLVVSGQFVGKHQLNIKASYI